MDEDIYLYDDSDHTEDSSAGDDSGEYVEDTSDSDGGDVSLGDMLKDILDGYFSTDKDDEEAGTESESETDGDFKEDSDTEQETDEDTEEIEDEDFESVSFDPEILSEINETLQHHADDVSGFISEFTVSGNALMVSFDDSSSALFTEMISNQTEVMERIDYLSGIMLMILFVLAFDIIHRFAKRIIKNLTRGDDEKNAADS